MIQLNVSLNPTFEAELSDRFTTEEAARRRNAFLNAYTAANNPICGSCNIPLENGRSLFRSNPQCPLPCLKP